MSIVERVGEKLGLRSKSPKGRAAQAAGDMDILDKLGQEHDEVQELLEKMLDSESGSERKKLLKQIASALVPHLRAEEKVVYDRVLTLKDKNSKIDGNEGYDEHALGDAMLNKLLKMKDATSPEWTAAAKVLKELVDHHIEEEEENLWVHVKDNFTDEERIQMNREFEKAKKKVAIPV